MDSSTLAALLCIFTIIVFIGSVVIWYDFTFRSFRSDTDSPSVEPVIRSKTARKSTGKVTLAELAELTFPEVGVLEELQCTICLDVITPEDPARKLSCNHAFHSSCISCWWKCSLQSRSGKVNCPSCRTDLEVDMRAALEQAKQQLQLSTGSAASLRPDEEEV
ncbi:unnamed protein product [Polarella glacialis]|uniref:RING-type domain-containing protein n=1 Tax=Polarella glacialis TaxID=89957 RepID=A0A813EC46_POLGL|nr:unnamed protein product [Polarella glacialis]